MDLINFTSRMKEECKKINVNLEPEQIEQFYTYMQELIEWNNKINLTAIIEPEEIIKKHFIDCLSIIKYIKDDNKIIDVGTGAGFPGIPIKIANKSLNMTLLDSLNKRISFLNEIITKLKLSNIETVHARAEEYIANGKREKYDIAVSRAVANLPTLLEYLMPYVKVNGICICMKGPKAQAELEESKKAIEILGGRLEKIENIKIDENMDRNIIIIRKIKNTPNAYPRKAGKPGREPIK